MRGNNASGGGEKGEPAAERDQLSWRWRSRDGAAPRVRISRAAGKRRGSGRGSRHGVPWLLALVGRKSGDGGEQLGGRGGNGIVGENEREGGIYRRQVRLRG